MHFVGPIFLSFFTMIFCEVIQLLIFLLTNFSSTLTPNLFVTDFQEQPQIYSFASTSKSISLPNSKNGGNNLYFKSMAI